MSSWYFTQQHPNDKIRESTLGEFFSNEAISRPGEALVFQVERFGITGQCRRKPSEIGWLVDAIIGFP